MLTAVTRTSQGLAIMRPRSSNKRQVGQPYTPTIIKRRGKGEGNKKEEEEEEEGNLICG